MPENNKKERKRLNQIAGYLSESMEQVLIEKHRDELSFDYVYDKVYTFFKDPILCEMIFDKLQESLEKNHNIDMRQKDI